MLLVREVFQAKYGRGDELIALLKELRGMVAHPIRILTDASGQFFTIVAEYEVENWAAWERGLQVEFSHPGFAAWFERMTPLVESGRRDFYNLVE